MRRPGTAWLGRSSWLLGLAAGCSLIVDPSIAGLPCGDGAVCREGYVCVNGACVEGSGGSGGGVTDPCGGCPSGTICDELSSFCIPSCTSCRPGQRCTEAGCADVGQGEPGWVCLRNEDCVNGQCLPSTTGAGVCGRPCGGDSDCGPGERCIPSNTPSGFCLPASFPSCHGQADCDLPELGGDLVCSYWLLGPNLLLPACSPPQQGSSHGSVCAMSSDCKTAICSPSSTCSTPCDSPGDDAGCRTPEEVCGQGSVFFGTTELQAPICVLR